MKKLISVGLLGLLLSGCSQIDTGNVGIESTFGQIKEQTLTPGIYFTVFKTVHEVSAKEHGIMLENMTPKAKDNVTLQDVDLVIYYRINPALASKIMTRYSGDMLFDKGADGYLLGVNLVTRVSRESAYQAFAMHSASEVHTKRTEVSDWMRKNIQHELDTDSGKGMFEITNVVIRNIVTDVRLEEAIKQSAEVEFAIRKKNQELELSRKEAERKLIEANGEAAANRVISESLSLNLIELRRIEAMASFAQKGTHTVVVPSGTNPLIQVK